MNNIKERNSSLDIIRIVAVIAVILTHISWKFVVFYTPGTKEFFLGNIIDSISRLGVPLFLMVSGSLMLDEEKNIGFKKMLKKIIEIVLILIFWSLIYDIVLNIILPKINGNPLNKKTIIYEFIMGQPHMWYLYMIVGLYLITPFLRLFVKKENNKMILLFIILSLLIQFTEPILNGLSLQYKKINYLIELINKIDIHFFCGYVAYYLTGWYVLNNEFAKPKRYIIYILSFISLILTILYVYFTKDYNNGYSNMNLFVFMYSLGVFLYLSNIKLKTNKILIYFSKISFGIYIIHPLIQAILDLKWPYKNNLYLYTFSYFNVVLILSVILCFVIAKMPVLKKSIRM